MYEISLIWTVEVRFSSKGRQGDEENLEINISCLTYIFDLRNLLDQLDGRP